MFYKYILAKACTTLGIVKSLMLGINKMIFWFMQIFWGVRKNENTLILRAVQPYYFLCTFFFNLQKIVSKMLLVIVTEKRRSPKKNLLFGEDVICCTKNGNIYYEIVGFKRAQSFQFYWNKLNPFDNWKVRMYS